MKNIQYILIVVTALLVTASLPAAEYDGTVRAGYVFTDLEGNLGVNQPTFNLYDGLALSLERFRYQWDNGMRLTGDLRNITMNNRRLALGLARPGLGGVTIRHTAYRRSYDFDDTRFTRRRTTNGSLWVQPIQYVKLFGGFGVTEKHGSSLGLFETDGFSSIGKVDYLNQFANVGVEFKKKRRLARVEYRTSDYSDDFEATGDRSSQCVRLTAYTPVPSFDDVVLSGGFQHYEHEVVDRSDTLTANTVWGAAKYTHKLGYHAKYSFLFDRARHTGDISATDNISQSIQIGKNWRSRGGIMFGYRYHLNDDVYDERSGSGYSLSGWLVPTQRLTLRAGLNFDEDNVDAGRTLTGNREYSRHWLSVRYRYSNLFVRAKLEDRRRDNDDIGSSVDLVRFSGDLSVTRAEYGELTVSYAYGTGEYKNSAGTFEYEEHVLSGEVTSREYRRVQAGFGGVYYRGRQDVDVESFEVKFTGKHRLLETAILEVIYSAHNFDNMADSSVPYREYYTANVVQANIIFEL
ncbi:MAG: hypothetical protein ABII79_03620 [bacterium]